jgi:hypothetical protein
MNNAVALPNDMIRYIVTLACPRLNLPSYNKRLDRYEDIAECDEIKKNLPAVAQKIISLRCICKDINTFIAENITSILCLDKTNMDAFLIRSLQANVPYFVKCAIAHNANSNAVHKPSGFTALLYAAEHNCYQACKLLLSKGADVNLKMQCPNAYGYSYNPYHNWPIHMAVKEGDAQLVALFAQAGANLNVEINGPGSSHTLLSAAVRRNDPEILETLLTFDSNAAYQNFGIEEIKTALAISFLACHLKNPDKERNPEPTDKQKRKIQLLEKAQEERQQAQERDALNRLLSQFGQVDFNMDIF